MLRSIETLVTWFSRILLWLGGVCVVVLTLHVVADVFMKYAFHRPIVGTLEIVSWYYMVGIAFLPVAWVQLKRQHLMVEMFTMGMSPRSTAVLDAVVGILALIYVAVLTFLVFEEAVVATSRNEIQDVTFFDMPVWPARWILFAGFASMTIVIFYQVCLDFVFGLTGRGHRSYPDKTDTMNFSE
ncbi:TRAP transporter small permease subunit [Tropicimonas isoalkanivorans]|uniref:TRAP transporter small permease protein n=1 Tax=Tropicimonas isoalkanivorans TaxID=441112 RepID=A0A1I1HWT0_9RHOB|nr:TRAP transporter small permease [Tropicimonas isoalkanivorans]SFC28336.1 TRAP-type C4-dicarboxylate transport system, small permease component [Tropicimonas isoalkanivorans]